MNTTLSQLHAWLGDARLTGDAEIKGVATDSRSVPGRKPVYCVARRAIRCA